MSSSVSDVFGSILRASAETKRPPSLLALLRSSASDEAVALAIMMGSDINECDIAGNTPLSESVARKRHFACEMLIGRGCYFHHDIIYQMIACGDSFAGAVGALMDRGFMLSMAPDDSRITAPPLEFARKMKCIAIVKVMVDFLCSQIAY
jgi:hypothetical protein